MDGVFAIYKPSGFTSSKFVGEIQRIFTNSTVFHEDLNKAKDFVRFNLGTNKALSKEKIEKKARQLKVKVGHGGTLDPLASGILIIGVGSGTKKLPYYLNNCVKEYRSKALLGISTTTGDSEGEILTQNKIDHITKELVLETAEKFRGDLKQTPPIFSALKLNGIPLYDYARKGIALPSVIKTRDVKVSKLIVNESDLLTVEHEFSRLHSEVDEDGKPKEHGLQNNPTLNDSPLFFSNEYTEKHGEAKATSLLLDEGEVLPEKLPLIHMTTEVSSGTYIRSLISDFGRALGSSAYMVELERSAQSQWKLGKNVLSIEDFERDERVWGKVLRKVLHSDGEINISEEFELAEKEATEIVEGEPEKVEGEPEKGEEQNGDAEKIDQPEGEKTDEQNLNGVSVESEEPALPKKRSIEEVEKE